MEDQGLVLYGPDDKPIQIEKKPSINDPRIWTVVSRGTEYGDSPPKDFKALLDAYTSWVQICVSKIAMILALTPIKLYRDDSGMGEDLGDPIERHRIYDIWKNPNPGLRQTRTQLFLKTWAHLELAGNAFWYCPAAVAGRPKEIYILRPDLVKIKFRGVGDLIEIIGYSYGDGELMIPPEEIVHFKYPHPTNPVYGLSRLSAQEYPYDIDHALGVHEYNFFKHRAVVDLIFAVKGMSRDQAIEFKKQYIHDHSGPEKAFIPSVIPAEDVTVEKITQTAKDSEVGALSNRVRDKLLSAYDVPAGKMGLIKDVNRANGDFIDTIFARDSLQPRADLFCEILSAQYCSRFDPRLVAKQNVPVPRDQEFEQKRDDENITNGSSTINEVRGRRGEKPVPWGDQWWAPLSYVPIGEGGNAFGGEEGKGKSVHYRMKDDVRDVRWKRFVAMTDPIERKMARELIQFFERQKGEILGRLDEFMPRIESTFDGWSKAKVKAHLKKSADLITQIIGDPTGYADEMAELMRPYEYEAYRAHGSAAVEELGALQVDFALAEVQGLEWVDWKVAESARKVNDATFLMLSDTLTEGLVAGEDIRALSGRVSHVFEGGPRAARTSAERIARTEIIGVSNKGAQDGYQAAGAGKKEWITAVDERTREWHDEANEQIVEIKGSFTVMGEKLEFPGDPAGSPENIINCRCTIGPIVSE